MDNSYGLNLKLKIYGGSHDKKIGMTLSGIPCGYEIDMERLQAFMSRRAPGNDDFSTKRREPDIPVFISGFNKNVTNGDTIEAVIYNQNQHSADYAALCDTPRPSHADLAAIMKYGNDVDLRGGGHFSGRLTAPMCIAGGIALQILEKKNIHIGAHIYSIGNITDTPFDAVTVCKQQLDKLGSCRFSVIDKESGEFMRKVIDEARQSCDSVGGIIECAVIGAPTGLGEHMFMSVEGRLSQILFGIPAVKGVEFGKGFAASCLYGSENNDPIYTDGKSIKTLTNNAGGILGGMTNGMPIVFRAAIKPTPSIAKEQNTISLSRMENVKTKIGGRHDPCIVPRAVPVVQAAAAIALLDMLLDNA